jgi:hypothetical protein
MPSVITPCGGGGGGGIQFDTTPQAGTFLQITTSTYMELDTEGSQGLSLSALGSGDVSLFTADGSVNIDGKRGIVMTGRGNDGIILQTSGDGDLLLDAHGGTGWIQLRAQSSSGRYIVLVGLPTSDPGVGGALWNDGGTLKIS